MLFQLVLRGKCHAALGARVQTPLHRHGGRGVRALHGGQGLIRRQVPRVIGLDVVPECLETWVSLLAVRTLDEVVRVADV